MSISINFNPKNYVITIKQTSIVRSFLMEWWDCIGLLLHTPQPFTLFCYCKIVVHFAPCYFGDPLTFQPTQNPPNPQKRVFTLTTHNKIHDNKSHRAFYGASNGLNFEPYCVEFLYLCLHDEETIKNIKMYLNLAS